MWVMVRARARARDRVRVSVRVRAMDVVSMVLGSIKVWLELGLW